MPNCGKAFVANKCGNERLSVNLILKWDEYEHIIQ